MAKKSKAEYKTDWDYNICYECEGYGNDYYIDDNGELVCNCDNCSFNPINESEKSERKNQKRYIIV